MRIAEDALGHPEQAGMIGGGQRLERTLVTLLCLALPAMGQSVDFTPLMNAKDVYCLWDNGQRIIGGLDRSGMECVWQVTQR